MALAVWLPEKNRMEPTEGRIGVRRQAHEEAPLGAGREPSFVEALAPPVRAR